MEYDLHSNVKVVKGIGATDGAAAGASTVSAEIDTLGYESLEWLLDVGTITTGTFTTLLEASPDDGAGSPTGVWTAVPAANILGNSGGAAGAGPSLIATDDDQVRRIGVISKVRHQRLTVVGAATPVADICVMALLGNPVTRPVPNQTTTS